MIPEIRPMQSLDLGSVVAIAAASPGAPAWQLSDYSLYLASQPPLLRTAFVALDSGSVIGFAAATLLRDPSSAPSPENSCELDSIAVQPALRRQGVASALLTVVVAWAEEHGSRRLTLEVRASNAAAIQLYERHGFVHEGLRPRYYADPVDDAVLLGKPLLP